MLGSVGEKSGRAGPRTPRSHLSDWTQGFCFRGVVLEGAAGRNRGAVLRRLRRHIEPMDEPQAEVLEEGRAARATAPECARRRVSAATGLVAVRLRARERRRVPACGQTRVQSGAQSGAHSGAQPGAQWRVSGSRTHDPPGQRR
jgi:hypothetical protein